jgi:peptide/nickel transport system permease protein
MPNYLLTRLGESLLAIWGVVTIVFVVTRVLGDPAVLLLPIGSPTAALAELRRQLGLDQPILTQYVHFLGQAVRGDFGNSYQYMRPAMSVVLERMPATLMLAGSAIVIGIVLGGIAGLLAAIKRNTIVEYIVMFLALIGQATPMFWLGIVMIMFFAVNLGWLPTGGYGSFSNLVLPAMTLGTFVAASVTRLFRSSILDVLREEHVRTARAKGLRKKTIYTWHVGRNALIPVVTMVAILTAELLGGSAVAETVFSWPGVGRLIVQSIETQDFPVVQAAVCLVTTIFVFINLLVDIGYSLLDPRIRSHGGGHE